MVNELAEFSGAQMHGAMIDGTRTVGGLESLHEVGPGLQYLQDDHDFELFEDTTGFVARAAAVKRYFRNGPLQKRNGGSVLRANAHAVSPTCAES